MLIHTVPSFEKLSTLVLEAVPESFSFESCLAVASDSLLQNFIVLKLFGNCVDICRCQGTYYRLDLTLLEEYVCIIITLHENMGSGACQL